ncbi:hypothetical protein ICW40_14255 [Actinotalea ferrariae]|uniref:hypothetical protein n=1 Tax=Actinotalea ferrariae TaxID=1386098 RepID=UPI001C8C45EC|nr:hypothetical protein [Actinotalea ferrariae]MBX9245967.1 hypothetical protein [Actinotalea ferrariae]
MTGARGGDKACWEFSDAWILAAIGDGIRHDELSGLVAAADHYNHSIPTKDEVGQGIGRLVASGLVTSAGRSLEPTPTGRTLLRADTHGGYEYVRQLFLAMARVPVVEGRWDLPPGTLERAYRRYAHPFTWWLPQRRRRQTMRGRH